MYFLNLMKNLQPFSPKPKNIFDEKYRYWREMAIRENIDSFYDKIFLAKLSSIGRDFPIEVDFLFKMVESGDRSINHIKSLFYSSVSGDELTNEKQQLSFRKFRG